MQNGLISGLSNSLVTRSKLSDPVHRATAISVLDRMSDIFLDLLRYPEAREGGHTIDLHLYWFCATSFVHSVLSGGNYPS
jgi:hypothetical protein